MSTIHLLDANVLIALTVRDHLAHQQATNWISRHPHFATCPITQGALLRFHTRVAGEGSFQHARAILQALTILPRHHFWPADLTCLEIPSHGLRGYGQITDFYLVALAAARQSRLATFDKALAAIHPQHCILIR
ncbi:MAG: PIN domain-containing protein [Acidobacteria bacterium]|nr:PIN domain-containing protein [Acidobacteriota bacterium]